MSMLFMSGWETGTSLDTWTTYSLGAGSGVSSAVRRGSQYSILFTNASDYCNKTLSPGEDELYAQFAILWTSTPTDGRYLIFADGDVDIASVYISGRRLALRISRTNVAFGKTILQVNQWYVIEVHYKAGTSDGVFVAKIDGVEECSYSGNTRIDGNCAARWRFESGALTTDSTGTNTLTNYNVTSNTSDKMEGGGCAEFDGTTAYFEILDDNLSADFPLKSTVYGKDFSVLVWIKADVLSNYRTIFDKTDCIWANIDSTYTAPAVDIELISNHEQSTVISTAAWSTGIWYHVAIRVYGQTSIVHYRVFNNSTGVATNYFELGNNEGVPYRSLNGSLKIGQSTNTYFLDGKMDEFLVFNGILGDNAVDSIRTGTYSGYTPTKIKNIIVRSPTANDVYIDDVIVNNTSGSYNNSWTGCAHISALLPMGEGSTQQMVGPFAKSHSQALRFYPTRTFFISAPAAGLTETFELDNTPALTTDILAVDAVAVAKTETYNPDVSSFKFFLQSGNTSYVSTATFTMTPGLSVVHNLWETSPISGITWTSTELDSLYLGVKT